MAEGEDSPIPDGLLNKPREKGLYIRLRDGIKNVIELPASAEDSKLTTQVTDEKDMIMECFPWMMNHWRTRAIVYSFKCQYELVN